MTSDYQLRASDFGLVLVPEEMEGSIMADDGRRCDLCGAYISSEKGVRVGDRLIYHSGCAEKVNVLKGTSLMDLTSKEILLILERLHLDLGYSDDPKICALQAKFSIMLEVADKRGDRD